MASLQDLPADQRAVLQMVLQRGRTYDEIAAMLSIDRAAVRQRALDACGALTPTGIEPGPERELVTDYLLSQLPEQVAQQVRTHLEAAPGDREWARAIAASLEQLASKPLPEIPVAAPPRSDRPAVVRESREPRREPAPAPSPSAARRRRGNARLWAALSVVAAALVALVVVLLANSGSSAPKAKAKAKRTHTTTTANSGPKILAALNLTSPVGAGKTLGVAQVVRDNGVVGIVIAAQGVPANSAHNAYGVWLYNSATSHQFVGFDPNLVGKSGKLAIEGTLPTDASDFKRLLITLETEQHPKTPGEVVLSGPFRER